eukprot:119662-Pyramimonas_sp.AAC.1
MMYALTSTLHALTSTLHALTSTRHALTCTLHALTSTMYALTSTQHALPSTLHALPSTRHVLPSTRHVLPSTQTYRIVFEGVVRRKVLDDALVNVLGEQAAEIRRRRERYSESRGGHQLLDHVLFDVDLARGPEVV